MKRSWRSWPIERSWDSVHLKSLCVSIATPRKTSVAWIAML